MHPLRIPRRPASRARTAERPAHHAHAINPAQLADVVDGGGNKPTDPGYDPLGSCSVGVGDATYHTTPIVTAIYDWCTDFNSDGNVTLVDALAVTDDIVLSASCTAQ